MAYDASAVANRFIDLAAEAGEKLTPMQIIKLTYIAHGFSLAINKRPLVDESVEAWRYGPVIPSLYRRLKKFGSSYVTEQVSHGAFRASETLKDEDQQLVDLVFKKYGGFSGVQLSHLTHRPGTPWAETYEPGVYGIDIDDAIIRTHYATLLNR